MATQSEPFYGCLCLETSDKRSLPQPKERENNSIPLPEVHFNIWEEVGKKTSPFLDIGVMLSVNDPAERIEIFLPWAFDASHIEDLSWRVLKSNGVSAVFNEAWATTSNASHPGGYVTRDDGSVFTILPYDKPVIEKRPYQQKVLHSIVLNIKELVDTSAVTAANAATKPSQMYVRLRVKDVPQSFYRVGIDQGDAFGGGALNRTEIIDFRLNVRRGVPPAIESFLRGRFVEFSKVQLFLMKSRDQDIAFEDKLFKACRSLEDEAFWAEYILPRNAPTTEVEACLKHVQNSLGYQWRKAPDASQTGVKEFGTLARFKSFKMNGRTIAIFLGLALAIGVIGNGMYDLLGWIASKL